MGRHAWKDKRRVNALDLLNDKAMTTVDLAERLSEGYHRLRCAQG
jgi:hypothetical protein